MRKGLILLISIVSFFGFSYEVNAYDCDDSCSDCASEADRRQCINVHGNDERSFSTEFKTSCMNGVHSGTCYYKTALTYTDSKESTGSEDLKINITKDSIAFEDIVTPIPRVGENRYIFKMLKTNKDALLKITNGTGEACPETIYGISDSVAGGTTGTTIYYVYERFKDLLPEKNDKGKVLKATLDKAELQCYDKPAIRKDIIKTYYYKCLEKNFKITKYADMTWGVTNTANVNFSSEVMDDSLKNTCCDDNPTIYYQVNFYSNLATFSAKKKPTLSNPTPQNPYRFNAECKINQGASKVDDPDYAEKHEKPTTLGDWGTPIKGPCDMLGNEFYRLLQSILKLVQIIGPILAITLGMVDFLKASSSGEDDAKGKAFKIFGKRFLASILLILIPALIKLILSLINKGDSTCGL